MIKHQCSLIHAHTQIYLHTYIAYSCKSNIKTPNDDQLPKQMSDTIYIYDLQKWRRWTIKISLQTRMWTRPISVQTGKHQLYTCWHALNGSVVGISFISTSHNLLLVFCLIAHVNSIIFDDIFKFNISTRLITFQCFRWNWYWTKYH